MIKLSPLVENEKGATANQFESKEREGWILIVNLYPSVLTPLILIVVQANLTVNSFVFPIYVFAT